MKTIITLLLTCFFVLPSSATEMGNEDIFAEANEVFDQANKEALVNPAKSRQLYQKSILKYQYLIEQRGVRSAELYTNLGNAYFSAGEQGWAVVNYQRALTIDPLQSEALHNLRYARSITIDALPATRWQKMRRALTCWHRWPLVWRAVCFGVAHLMFWSLLAVLFYRRGRWLYGSLAATALVSLLFGLSLLVSHQRWDNPVDGVIIEREVIARHGNGVIYENAFTSPLHAGTEFSVIEQRGDWYHVKLLNGDNCWLPDSSVEFVRD